MSQDVITPPAPPKKKKTVSFSQFSNWWTCPHRWMRDYILHEKTFEDSLNMCFGTGIHEAIQNYLRVLFTDGEEKANAVNNMEVFKAKFQTEIAFKKIAHTQADFDSFVKDGENILKEFLDPVNRLRYFPTFRWELLAIEDNLNVEIRNNVVLNGKLDIVFREKTTGNIRIIDFKTSNNGWTTYQKEDFTKTSQLVLYKALYSKKYNVPLSKIQVEFIILRRNLYEDASYEQSRLQVFKPSSYQNDVLEVIQEFTKFVETCFTPEGVHKTGGSYPKIPGKNKKNCKYCPHLKKGTCDGKPSIIKLD